MEVISRRPSSLNPNAPIYVPCAFQVVEDFSDKWWELVQSSTWFRDYWLQERFEDLEQPGNPLDNFVGEDFDFLSEIDSAFDGHRQEDNACREIVSLGALKWRRPQIPAESMKFMVKVPKIVNNMKVSPRMIQQPR